MAVNRIVTCPSLEAVDPNRGSRTSGGPKQEFWGPKYERLYVLWCKNRGLRKVANAVTQKYPASLLQLALLIW